MYEPRNGKRKEEIKITEAGGRFQKTLGVWNHSYFLGCLTKSSAYALSMIRRKEKLIKCDRIKFKQSKKKILKALWLLKTVLFLL